MIIHPAASTPQSSCLRQRRL